MGKRGKYFIWTEFPQKNPGQKGKPILEVSYYIDIRQIQLIDADSALFFLLATSDS